MGEVLREGKECAAQIKLRAAQGWGEVFSK